jgi:diguanylate cyclase (GGDEF)-like protein
MRLGMLVHGYTSEYPQNLIKGVERFCRENGIDLFIFLVGSPSWNNETSELLDWGLLSYVNRENLDGVVVLSGTICHFISLNRISGILKKFNPLPLVSVSIEIPGYPSIVTNQETGFNALITHLIEKHGCKRFAFLSAKTKSKDIFVRYKIFRNILKHHGVKFDEKNLFYGDYTFSSVQRTLSFIKSKDDLTFDALIVATDDMAFGAIAYFHHIGLNVPGDVIVTGFDDITKASCSNPTLTTVNQMLEKQGYIGAELVFRQTKGEKVQAVTTIDAGLRCRNSCGCIPMGDLTHNAIDENGNFIDLTSEFMFNSTTKFLSFEDQILKIQQYMDEVQGFLSLEELAKRFEFDFITFNIIQAGIFLYDEPLDTKSKSSKSLPGRARIFFAMNKKENFLVINGNEFFDCTKRLMPDECKKYFFGKNFVIPVYNADLIFGYFVFQFGETEPISNSLFYSTVSKLIASAYEVSKKERENKNLAKINANLSLLSKNDELTKVLNRRGFMETAQDEISRSAEKGKSGLVIYGDIDGLKKINDNFGHESGDRAILTEVEILKKSLRSSDLIGRLGGDEFAILSVSMGMENFENLKERVDGLCRKWNENSGEPFKISISLGAVEFSAENQNLTRLLKLADTEQYKEKARHKKAMGIVK